MKNIDVAKRMLDYRRPCSDGELPADRSRLSDDRADREREPGEPGLPGGYLREIARETREEPETVHDAPHDTPVRRLDEGGAARNLVVRVGAGTWGRVRVSEAALEWTVHPVRERPRLGILVLGVILAMSVGSWFWMRSAFWPLFSFLVLFLSLESFYFPTRFRARGGEADRLRRFSRSEREWAIFRRCQVDRDGMTLSPYRKPTFMDGYRAIRLRWGSVEPRAGRRVRPRRGWGRMSSGCRIEIGSRTRRQRDAARRGGSRPR